MPRLARYLEGQSLSRVMPADVFSVPGPLLSVCWSYRRTWRAGGSKHRSRGPAGFRCCPRRRCRDPSAQGEVGENSAVPGSLCGCRVLGRVGKECEQVSEISNWSKMGATGQDKLGSLLPRLTPHLCPGCRFLSLTETGSALGSVLREVKTIEWEEQIWACACFQASSFCQLGDLHHGLSLTSVSHPSRSDNRDCTVSLLQGCCPASSHQASVAHSDVYCSESRQH